MNVRSLRDSRPLAAIMLLRRSLSSAKDDPPLGAGGQLSVLLRRCCPLLEGSRSLFDLRNR